MAISPGVYTKIIDLSSYLQDVPGTIGFVPFLSRRGPDNELKFIGGLNEFKDLYGTPNIFDFGKSYGQGPYICWQHLTVSTSLFAIRCLPDDAEYSNLFLILNTDTTAVMNTISYTSMNSKAELDTKVAAVVGNDTPVGYFYPIGRGDSYDDFAIKLSTHANTNLDGVYILDVYETQADGDDLIVESFEISFDENAIDDSSESMYIVDVLERFSKNIKFIAHEVNLNTALGTSVVFDTESTLPIHLANGSEGTLVSVDGVTGKRTINSTTATQVLTQGYTSLLTNPKTNLTEDNTSDLDNIYFTLVYDAGYPSDVKTAAYSLVNDIRRDCVCIADNGDNVSYTASIDSRININTFNSRYIALYEPYSKVYDVFTGRDLWLSPVFHMARMVPLNDRLYEVWYASAGFNRGTIASIKELRFSPKLGQRDQMYLNQLNPIVKFNVGNTMWGQLTSQKKPTALQDLNVIRLLLYIKRALEQFCKFFIFEFNDAPTWNEVTEGIAPFLERIKSKRGLKSYSVEVGATEYEFKAKIMHVNIVLVPMKVIEKIELNLFVK